MKTKTSEGVVFGIPINQTVLDPNRKRSTGIHFYAVKCKWLLSLFVVKFYCFYCWMQIVVWIKMICFLDIPSDEMMSPTSKSSRSDSRTSFGSIFDSPMKDKSMERVSLVVVTLWWCLAYLFSFISFSAFPGWISTTKSRKLRVSGWYPEIISGWRIIHCHVGYSLILQLWQTSGTWGSFREDQSSTLCTFCGHNLH